MTCHADILEALFDAIDAVPDAPDLEQVGPAEVARMGAQLALAADQLGARVRLWAGNARKMLPEWENHHEEGL